jgi:pimeloyl-ACP methyl ester carboxylesterase
MVEIRERHNWRIIRNTQGQAGCPLLVLSHGYGTDHRTWRYLLPYLLPSHEVAVYDLAGAGPDGKRSFNPAHHTSIEAYADDLIEMLDLEGRDHCTVIGHSVSGMTAVIAARARPDLFDRVIMIAGSPRYLNDGEYYGGFEPEDLDKLFGAMEANYQTWSEGFAPAMAGEKFPETIEEFVSGLREMRPDIAVITARFIFQSDFRNLLPDIRVPVVAIQPMRDMAVPVEVGHYLQAQIPDCQLELIDTDGHLPHLTYPEEVLRTLAKYLDIKPGGDGFR